MHLILVGEVIVSALEIDGKVLVGIWAFWGLVYVLAPNSVE